jgi:L-lactate dehydrogenase complex protein LldG
VTAREGILQRVRAALGRSSNTAIPEPPPVRLRISEANRASRIASFKERLEALAARVVHAATPAAARDCVESLIAGKAAIASNAPYLGLCGIAGLPGVRSGIADREQLRQLCAGADVGITCADYALADTGTLVMFSTPLEARLISLLPPAHIAILPEDRLLSGLDELFSVLPDPASISSSMVLITGPSRTADIEQILVRGVHGPGQLTVVLVTASDRSKEVGSSSSGE